MAEDAPISGSQRSHAVPPSDFSLNDDDDDDDAEFLQAAHEAAITAASHIEGEWTGNSERREITTPEASLGKHLREYEDNVEKDEAEAEAEADAFPEALHAEKQAYMETDAYRPNVFGDFKSYMRNKRLKLKVQEESMTDNEVQAMATAGTWQPLKLPSLFKGTNIYINGHTNPPYGELRRLLHLYGASLMPYLDQKTPVTHIIASNLTAKKRIEFKDYKVVRPEWVTQSIAEGRKLDWRDFRCAEDASGAMQMGTLGSKATFGSSEGPVKGDIDKDEERKRIAARGDWRILTKDDNGGSVSNLDTPAVAMAAAESIHADGVGPWGKGSRQKTLAGWGRKEIDLSDMHSESTEKGLKRSQVAKEAAASNAETNLFQSIHPPRDEDKSNIFSDFETPPRPQVERDEGVQEEKRVTAVRELNEKHFPSLGTDPPTAAAAYAAGLHHSSHPYASRPSNIAAAQLLASPSWRQKNTATSDDFLAGFFEKSRLHHLSTWKSEMKEMVSQALREAGKEQGSTDLPSGVNRVIMHIDFDAFFVSVGLRNRPELRDKAIVVCHGTSTTEGSNNGSLHSTSEIASCNYIARSYGIRNGMSLGQANRLCQDVHTIAYDFVGYNEVAISFYTILLLHADALEAVSIDEALIDVSLLLNDMRAGKASEIPERNRLMASYRGLMYSQGEAWSPEKQLAEALRDEIRNATGCEASIGIGDNVLLARMATRKAKPGGAFHLRLDDFAEFAAELDVDDLHGIGWSIRNRCRDTFGTFKIGELHDRVSKGKLVAEFGDKQGVTIWDKLHGRERNKLETVKQRQSCGASVNYAIRFETDGETKHFVAKLSEEVSNRLKAIKLVGRVCCISIMVRSKDAPVEAPKFMGHGVCDTFNRSAPLARATDDKDVIFSVAWKLLVSLKLKPDQLRGIGVSCQKLQPKEEAMRPAGQAVLRFAIPTSDQKATLTTATTVAEDDEAGESDEQQLEPGPLSFDTRRRSPSPEETTIKVKTRSRDSTGEILFPSTQFVIPPASQLDPEVIAALPEKIRAQIEHAQKSTSDPGEGGKVRASSVAPLVSASPPLASASSTPEKHRTSINPFLSMRAASTTPSKKAIRQQKNLAARNSTFEIPRVSQLDPTVLAELPSDVRQEILREAGGFASRLKTNPGASAQSTSSPLRSRDNSESPHKARQQYHLFDLIKAKGTEELGKANSENGDHHDLRTSDVGAFHTARTSLLAMPDPKRVTEEDLIRLEIDPDFFVALPEEMQKETLREQTAFVSDKQARFKSGKQSQELSLQEERRLQTQTAFPLPDVTFQAKPVKLDEESNRAPNLKGKRTLDQVRSLIDVWFSQFQSAGPRQKDVDRVARFLLECVETAELEQLAKVRELLKWWWSLLQRSSSSSSSPVGEEEHMFQTHREWWAAFEQVRSQIDELVKKNLGAQLSLR